MSNLLIDYLKIQKSKGKSINYKFQIPITNKFSIISPPSFLKRWREEGREVNS
jgi:hypothetical protein